MPNLLTLSKIEGPVDNPPKPILPVGGRPTEEAVISALWRVTEAEPGAPLVFRSLDDLSFSTTVSTTPTDARFAVYLGDNEDEHPAFLALTDLTKGGGTKGPYRLSPCITKLTKKLVITGHTLGLEIVETRGGPGAIRALSRIKQSTGRNNRRKGKKSKTAGAR